ISIALIFITVGIEFKLSPVPSHQWTPDVYEGVRIALYRLSSRVGDKQTRTADIRHRGSMVGPRPLDAFLHLAYVLHVAFRPNDSMNLRRYLRIVR
ncbi:hypothetical protein S245_051977, partial [Arachis hypogaea]